MKKTDGDEVTPPPELPLPPIRTGAGVVPRRAAMPVPGTANGPAPASETPAPTPAPPVKRAPASMRGASTPPPVVTPEPRSYSPAAVTPAPAFAPVTLSARTPDPDLLGSTTPPPEVMLPPATPSPPPIAIATPPSRAGSPPAVTSPPFVPAAPPYRSSGTTPLPSKPSSGRNNLPLYLQQTLQHTAHMPPRRARRMVRGVTLSKSALAGIWLLAFALGMVTTVIVERFRPSVWSEPPPPPEPAHAAAQPTRGPGVEIVTLPPPEPAAAPTAAPPATAPSPP